MAKLDIKNFIFADDSCQCCRTPIKPYEGDEDTCNVICPNCWWEQDTLSSLDDDCNPNNLSLREARKNYKEMGACDEHGVWCKKVIPEGPEGIVE